MSARRLRSCPPSAGTWAAVVLLWLAVWALAEAGGWHPRPLALLAVAVLVAALLQLVGALAPQTSSLPRVVLRATPASPVGEDARLLRHQLRLQDAAARPPSCRPALNHIADLARERLRLLQGGEVPGAAPRELLGQRLSGLVERRPPDRTYVSPRELAQLLDDLEAVPTDTSVHALRAARPRHERTS